MSFSKAALRRFNELDAASANLPGPTQYAPQECSEKRRGISLDRSARFAVPDASTPGPAHYNVSDARKASHTGKRSSVCRTTSFRVAKTKGEDGLVSALSGSLNDMSFSSTASSAVDVFFTPQPKLSLRQQLEQKVKELEQEKEDVAMSHNFKVEELQAGLKAKETIVSEQELKISILEEGIEELKDRLEVTTNDRDAVTQEVKNLESKKRELELDLAQARAEFETEIKKLTASENAKVGQIRELKEKMEADVARMSNELQQAQESNNSLRTKLEEEMHRLKAEISRWQKENAALKSAFEDEMRGHREKTGGLEKDLEISKKLVNDYYEIIEETRHDLNENEMKLASLCGSFAALQSENEQLRVEHEDQKALLEAKSGQEVDLIQYIEKLHAQIEELKDDKIDLNQTCVILEGHMNKAREERDNWQFKAQSLQQNLEDANNQREEIKVKFDEQKSVQDGQVKELEEQKAALLRSLKESELTSKELLSDKQRLEENVKKLADDLSNRIQIIKALEMREDELTKRNSRLRNELEQQESGLQTELVSHWEAEDELERVKAELHRTEAQLCYTQNEVTKYGVELNALQKEKELMFIQVTTLNESVALLSSELDGGKKIIECQKKQLQEAQKKLEKEARMTDRTKKKCDSLTLQLEDAKEEHLLLKQSQERCEEMAKYLEEYMNQVDSLREDLVSRDALITTKQTLIDKQEKELRSRDFSDDFENKYIDLKAKYDSLQSLIEPFRTTLEQYKKDRIALSEDNCSEEELGQLAEKVGFILGHQNHNQKIKHVCRINKENVAMKLELGKLRRQNDRLRKTLFLNNKENPVCFDSKRKVIIKDADRRLSEIRSSQNDNSVKVEPAQTKSLR